MTDTVRYVGACEGHGHTRDLPRSFGKYVWVWCEAQQWTVELHKLGAKFSTSKCNDLCMDATGPACVCGCGGANHGGSWANQRTEADNVMKDNPDLADAYEWCKGRDDLSDFLADLTEKLSYDLALTDKQVEAYIKAVVRTIEREQEAKDETPMIDAPEGRVTFTGKVLSTREPGEFDQYPSYKMLMRIDTKAGYYKVWVTVPGALRIPERGDVLTLKATLQPKETGFAFAKRPAVIEAPKHLTATSYYDENGEYHDWKEQDERRTSSKEELGGKLI